MQSCVVKKPEILAPAGSLESLKVAVNHGADAVYLGLKSFSARAKAENFDEEKLREAVRYAHFYNVRIYLAVNTLFLPEEKEEVFQAIKIAHEIGVDAIILQDLTLLPQIKRTMPDIIVHLSTQCGIHNLYGAKMAKRLGADRIILSREVTIDDIKDITQNCDIEVECFVQGALCVSFSGNCYFSSLVSGYSGNRGKCLQLCRKKYTLKGKDGYWLSTKDLCLSNSIQALIDAGVCSLKIEGRMRRPEYVGSAVSLYRKILDDKPYDLNEIKSMYNRGDYTNAHLFSPTNKVIYSHAQGHIGLKCAKVVKIEGKKAKLSRSFSTHDAIKFLRNQKEVGTAKIYANGNETTYLGQVKVGDEVRLTTDYEQIQKIANIERFVKVNCEIFVKAGEQIYLKIYNNRCCEEYYSSFTPSIAQKAPLSNQDIKAVLSKCKDYSFILEDCVIHSDEESFVAKSLFNEFRRDSFANFYAKYCNSYKKPIVKNRTCDMSVFEKVEKEWEGEKIFVQTNDFSKLNYYLTISDLISYNPRDFVEFYNQIEDFTQESYLFTPQIARKADLKLLEKVAKHPKIQNVIVNNLYALELFKDKNIILGPYFNIIDDSFAKRKILSVEGGISKDSFTYAFGYFPFMSFVHCIKKEMDGGCENCKKYDSISINDENGNVFSIAHYKIAYCYSHLLNDKSIDLSQFNEKNRLNRVFLDFSYYKENDEANIINCFKCGKSTKKSSFYGFANKNLE